MFAQLLQSCPTLCDSTDCSPPGSSVHGILQAGVLEWAAMSFSMDLPDPGIKPVSLTLPALTLAGRFLITSTTCLQTLPNVPCGKITLG